MRDGRRHDIPAATMADLTERQAEVARLAAEGLGNKEVAARLRLSPDTTKNTLTHVYRRTGTGNRTELARWVWEQEAAR